MKLHIFRNSPNCRKALATINYLKLDVELVLYELSEGQYKSDAFLSMNPNGKTPTLDDNGFTLWESNAITQYLSDSATDHSLLPQDKQSRANITRWQFWESNHYGRAVGDILWERFAKELFTGEPADPADLEDALQRFHTYAPILNQQLAAQAFVAGNSVTLADFSMACHAGFIEMAGVPINEYPQIVGWYQRLNEVSGWIESAPELG